MQLQRSTEKRSTSVDIIAAVIVAIVLAATTWLVQADLPALSVGSANAEASDMAYAAGLPDRSFAFQSASGTTTGTTDDDSDSSGVDDGRLSASVPGAEAVLSAVYPASGGNFAIWSIDPNTGVGTFAFLLLRQQVDAAILEAAATGAPVLIAPVNDDGTPGALPHVYATPDGECVILTSFKDGKTAQIPFDC